MRLTPPGWLRPEVKTPLSGAEAARIGRICPGLGQREARAADALWGPWRQMREGWATDPDLRHAGASGGGLTAILTHLLSRGRVAAALVTVADPEVPYRSATRLVTEPGALRHAAGSRYAPSAPLAALPEALAFGRPVAFVGKPCDAAALRALAAEDPLVAEAVPIVLSFFCAGVPSEAGTRALLAAMGAPPEAVRAFRYRGMGWPGMARAELRDGGVRTHSYTESWGAVLSKHLQHRCKICADGTGWAADLVCADPWESDARGYPLFDEAPGRSLFVARTSLGAEILAEAEAAGRIETRPFEASRLAGLQPGQRERRRAVLARLLALRATLRPVPRYRGMALTAAARQAPLRRLLRNFLGMARRSVLRWRTAG